MKSQAGSSKSTRRDFLKTVAAGIGAVSSIKLFYPRAFAQEKKPIIIGAQLDMTGTTAAWGYWHEKAARAAVDKINKEGGIAGRPIKYILEDTESNTPVCARKFKKLVEAHNADFVIGTQWSAGAIATNPTAKELKTLYFPTSMAGEITAEKGNRWVCRIGTHATMQAQVAHKWAVENMGKKWGIIVTSMAWGQSHAAEWSKRVKAAGGEVLTTVTIPVGTDDFIPYLVKVPSDIEVLFNIFWSEEQIKFLKQSYGLGLHKFKRFTVICTIEGISTVQFKDVVEGAWFVEYLPRRIEEVPSELREINKKARQFVGINDEGDETGGTGKTSLGSHYWMQWSHVHLIKHIVEKTGWKSKNDNPAFIGALESGLILKASLEFPQGDIFMRPEDHQGFHDHYISRVEGGKLKVKGRIDKEKAIYPAAVDYRKEPI